MPDVFMNILSVSTSGSKGVQHRLSRSCLVREYPFSIHKRIEGGATNLQPQPQPALDNLSVSTSGSKGVQPGQVKRQPHFNQPFSIHKRIEGGATERGGRPTPLYHTLSVSTSGSKGVQLRNHSAAESGSQLSVSTSGSKGVQPMVILNFDCCFCAFQYPQADRRGCNILLPA